MPNNTKRKKLLAKMHNHKYREGQKNADARKAVESWPDVNLVLTLLVVAIGAGFITWLS